MYSDILVPVDRGYSSNKVAAREAARLAEEFDSTIHGLFVIVEGGQALQYQQQGPDPQPIERLEAFLDDWDVPVTTDVRGGAPSEEICSYAENNDIDAIVMATYGRTGFRRFALGSVSEDTIRGAPCPVLTVTEKED